MGKYVEISCQPAKAARFYHVRMHVLIASRLAIFCSNNLEVVGDFGERAETFALVGEVVDCHLARLRVHLATQKSSVLGLSKICG